MTLALNPTAFVEWTRLLVDSLALARAEIDALNVFPVPDSDTGTNAYLTFVAGGDALGELDDDADLADMIRTYANGLLMGAKGNSGVILSQLVRACFAELAGAVTMGADDVARAFASATQAAYDAVGVPVEGTILSVSRAASDGAAAAAADGADPRQTFTRAAQAARVALAHTPEQMEKLARAGVVDAGGRALVVVLDATEQALTGRFDRAIAPKSIPVPILSDDLVAGGPAYEVMYLLDATDVTIPELRRTLAGLGDSLVVVGGEGLWNIHIHVDEVGKAIEAGIAAGRPYRIAVTHFADQIAANSAYARSSRHGRVVIAATTGAGLTDLCGEAGATTLSFDRSQQLTIAAMKAALRDTRAEEIVVLPNNPRYVGLFEAAAKEARIDGLRIAVIPTHAQVEGLAALAVHDAGRSFDEDVVAMTSAAAHTGHGAITVAAEPGMTMVGPCAAGDILGVVAGDFAYVGSSSIEVAIEVVDRIVSPGTELVTLVVGHGAEADLATAVEAHLQQTRPDIDTMIYSGGQENYPLFVAAE